MKTQYNEGRGAKSAIRYSTLRKKLLAQSISRILLASALMPAVAMSATLQGIKYDDVTQNGAYNRGEPLLANHFIYIRDAVTRHIVSTKTDANGKYSMELGAGDYTVWTAIPWNWKQNEPKKVDGGMEAVFPIQVNVPEGGNTVLNFGIYNPAVLPKPSNNSPVADINPDVVVTHANQKVAFSGIVTDKDAGDVHSFHWDFGDGSSADMQNAEHIYTTSGVYKVKLTVDDGNENGMNTAEITVTVENTPPSVEILEVLKASAGESVSFDCAVTDPDGGVHTYRWDFGDGSNAATKKANHTFIKAGNYKVTLQVTDAAGAVTEETLNVVIGGAKPVVDAGEKLFANIGENVELRFEISDIDDDRHNVFVDFDDGNNAVDETDESAEVMFNHVFLEAKNHTVTVLARDEAGNEGIAQKEVVVRSLDSDPCAAGVATMHSVKTGEWDNAETWSTGTEPTAEDWVLISSGTQITLPDNSKTDTITVIKGLCVDFNGQLQSAPNTLGTDPNLASSVNIAGATVNNKGMILGQDGMAGSGPMHQPLNYKHATSGSSIFIQVARFVNTGSIIAGSGGIDSTWKYMNDNDPGAWSWQMNNRKTQYGFPTLGGAGGEVNISATIIDNRATIQSGVGGYADSAKGAWTSGVHGLAIGGGGGKILLNATDLEESKNSGRLVAGCGGEADIASAWKNGDIAWQTNDNPSHSGLGGNIFFNVGEFSGKAEGCVTSVVSWDPTVLRTTSTTRFEGFKKIEIFGGDDDWVMELKDLAEGAISAEEIVVAVGKDGKVDFTGTAVSAFKATKKFTLAADTVTLEPGVTLEALIDTPELVKEPAKLLHRAVFSGKNHITGDPGRTLEVKFKLLNMGPKEDTYLLELKDAKGWTVSTIPEFITVNSMRSSEIRFNVTLPAERGAENVLTLTAASTNDPTMRSTMEVNAKVMELPEAPKPVPVGTKVDYSFVIDDTGSMGGEIRAVAAALEAFVETVDGTNPPMVELITFKDDVTSRIVTNDMGELITQVRSLSATGGGDCPESSVLGLEKAIESLTPGGQVLIATDASAHKSAEAVTAQLKANRNKTHVILAGSCGNEPADKAFYKTIADETGGGFHWAPRGTLTADDMKEIILGIIEKMMVGDYSVFGQIKDALGNPIGGVTVEVDGQEVVTDALGNWRITGLQGDMEYIVKASKDGMAFAPRTYITGNRAYDVALHLQPVSELTMVVLPHVSGNLHQGEALTYNVSILNGGKVTATGLTLEGLLPNGASIIEVIGAVNEANDGTLRCTLPDLAAGESLELQVKLATDALSGRIESRLNLQANEYQHH